VDAKSTKEKWSELDAKGKFQFFKDYYLLKTVIIVAVVVLLGSIIWAVVKPKPTSIKGILILDSLLDETEVNNYFEGIVKDMGLDTSKYTYSVYDDYSSNASSDVTAVSTLLYAGTIQVVIATTDVIDRYAQNEILLDMSNLPSDIKAALSEEDLHYSTIVETDDFGKEIEGGKETKILSGINLTNSKFINATDTNGYGVNYVYSILITEDPGVAYDTLRALLGLPMCDTYTPKK